MKLISQPLKSLIVASAALLFLALPGCHKTDSPPDAQTSEIITKPDVSADNQKDQAEPQTGACTDTICTTDTPSLAAPSPEEIPPEHTDAQAKDAPSPEKPSSNPIVQFGIPTVTGPLSTHIVQKIVSSHTSELRECYENALAHNNTLAGEVTLSWTNDTFGHAKEASIEASTLNDQNIEQCLLETVSRWRFPDIKSLDLVKIKYPISFMPSDADH